VLRARAVEEAARRLLPAQRVHRLVAGGLPEVAGRRCARRRELRDTHAGLELDVRRERGPLHLVGERLPQRAAVHADAEQPVLAQVAVPEVQHRPLRPARIRGVRRAEDALDALAVRHARAEGVTAQPREDRQPDGLQPHARAHGPEIARQHVLKDGHLVPLPRQQDGGRLPRRAVAHDGHAQARGQQRHPVGRRGRRRRAEYETWSARRGRRAEYETQCRGK